MTRQGPAKTDISRKVGGLCAYFMLFQRHIRRNKRPFLMLQLQTWQKTRNNSLAIKLPDNWDSKSLYQQRNIYIHLFECFGSKWSPLGQFLSQFDVSWRHVGLTCPVALNCATHTNTTVTARSVETGECTRDTAVPYGTSEVHTLRQLQR